MAGVRYIGNRPTHIDHLYGTGLVWEPDQVHNVEEQTAKKMLAHTDTYAEARAVKGEKPVKPAEKKVEQDEEERREVPLPQYEHMSKADLQDFAQLHFGEQLDGRMTMETMRDRITALMHSGNRR